MPSILNSDDGVVSGTSGLKTTGGNDGLLNIQTNGTTAISISSGQRSTFPTTIGVGNATPSTSGSGITFPASQSASSDANTLDDYEEGTFEAVITGSTGGTATGQAGPGSGGTYIKIGKMVYCQFYFANPAITGTISGDLRLSLPFTVANASRFDNGSAGFFSTTREISSGSTSTDIRLQGSGGNAFAILRQYYIGSRTESNNLSQATASINGSTLLWGTFNFVTT